jgi:adenylyltransferase/sulfurtransferase
LIRVCNQSAVGRLSKQSAIHLIMLNPDPNSIQLTQDDYERYSRHLILPEVGVEGQKRLKAASVLCIGTGGLGSPLLLYLAAAGVGRIGIVDFDVVDTSNLQRQVIHSTSSVGKPKIESAKARI